MSNQKQELIIYYNLRCNDCIDFNIKGLCHRHINTYCSEFYLCEQCLKNNGIETKGNHRYDSLVLCDEHNKPMGDIMNKLHSILDNNPNVTVIKDLGL